WLAAEHGQVQRVDLAGRVELEALVSGNVLLNGVSIGADGTTIAWGNFPRMASISETATIASDVPWAPPALRTLVVGKSDDILLLDERVLHGDGGQLKVEFVFGDLEGIAILENDEQVLAASRYMGIARDLRDGAGWKLMQAAPLESFPLIVELLP